MSTDLPGRSFIVIHSAFLNSLIFFLVLSISLVLSFFFVFYYILVLFSLLLPFVRLLPLSYSLVHLVLCFIFRSLLFACSPFPLLLVLSCFLFLLFFFLSLRLHFPRSVCSTVSYIPLFLRSFYPSPFYSLRI